MKKIIAFALLVMLVAAGCATTEKSVCDDNEDAVICKLADKMGQSPEQVAQVLKIANITALAGDVCTARQAMDFVADLQVFLKDAQASNATYWTVIAHIVAKYQALPPDVQIAFLLLQTVAGVQVPGMESEPLTDADYAMLSYHLNEQLQIITSFLATQTGK
jgi:hypothetical protein